MENGNIIADQTPEKLGIKKAVNQMSDAEFKKLAKELAGKQKTHLLYCCLLLLHWF